MSQDNEIGLPMFNPELTGHELRGAELQDWISFCHAVRSGDGGEDIYSTWFENRWMRASEKAGGQGKTREKSVVRATLFGDTIIIHCPTKLWAENLTTHMRTLRTLRTHSQRRFIVAGPGEKQRPGSLRALKATIAECRELAAADRYDYFGRPLDGSKYRAFERIGMEFMARHEQRGG